MAITKQEKAKIVKEFGGNEKNTGKTEVQIAILTAEISSLTNHLVDNKKDNTSKRGLYKKVSQRKSLLTYLKNTDINRYREIIKKLNLRGN
ncbi:30S ribosomal protein S15 [Malacoplasma iowae]|uniref:Small ribosomal subunit protein uS15 n=1 Tax=Malacoplasma iowae 695 TaxID=1048830 RepID=A0A6P1LDS0_MALIO|nr:30S ribosomal protein S15 [Malacoplasma iowae]VEU63275.1 30S ribosomal protein S15 [Mycoplasmopsis fermentans]EGZ31219.1 30S ribosomal protein S15 [Malacoplasma iowae 695]QHG89609.1 30S ribosomal protein S15 [Malacoplasma iowae 695]WPL35612.1 30S ribosomal protein S15 [Malacoplasma iowae]VEU72004.1 30S ribosomal protein S15 [Malacoplasma iowae]